MHNHYFLLDKLKESKLRVAVAGATGHFGRKILEILAEHKFPAEKVVALGSCVNKVSYGPYHALPVFAIHDFDFGKVNAAIFAMPPQVVKKYIGPASKSGCFVINCSSDEGMGAVVPTISDMEPVHRCKAAVNPHAVSTQIIRAIHPIHKANPIKRIVATTYQSVSDLGKKAMDELYQQTKRVYSSPSFGTEHNRAESVMPKSIVFNCLPHVGDFLAGATGDITSEEARAEQDMADILNISSCITCVRVPVFVGNGIVLNIQCSKKINLNAIKEILRESDGIGFVEADNKERYLTPIECVQDDLVFVSRLRLDSSIENTMSMWTVADNIRISALNAVQTLGSLLNLVGAA